MRRSLLPVTLSNRRNISSKEAMSMSQTSFLMRRDGLKSKFSGACAITLLVRDGPAVSSESSSCRCSCSWPFSPLPCSPSANFLLFLDWPSPLLILVRKATPLYILVTFFLNALREGALRRYVNLLPSSIDSCSLLMRSILPRRLYLFRHLTVFLFVSVNILRTSLPPEKIVISVTVEWCCIYNC